MHQIRKYWTSRHQSKKSVPARWQGLHFSHSLRMNLFTLLLETLCKNQRPKMKLNTGIKHTLLQFQCKQSVVTYWAITSSNRKAKELARWTALYLVAKQPKSKKYNNVNDVMLPSPFQLLPKQDDDHQLLKSHSLYRRGLPSKMLEHTWAQKASHHFVREVEHEDFHCSAEDHSEASCISLPGSAPCYSAFLFHPIRLQHLLPNITH